MGEFFFNLPGSKFSSRRLRDAEFQTGSNLANGEPKQFWEDQGHNSLVKLCRVKENIFIGSESVEAYEGGEDQGE